MNDNEGALNKILTALQERAKELDCLYKVEESLAVADATLEEAFNAVTEVIPPGWQYPEITRAEINYEGERFAALDFQPTPWSLSADIAVQQEVAGTVRVFYLESRPREDVGPFLKEEVRLINTIAERLGHFVLYQRLKNVHQEWAQPSAAKAKGHGGEWRGPVHLLRESDKNLYLRIARKMLNHLLGIGVSEAATMLRAVDAVDPSEDLLTAEANVPGRHRQPDNSCLLSDRPFELAGRHLSDDEILLRVQRWLQEDKASFFNKVLNNPRSSLPEIADALRRYHHIVGDGSGLSHAMKAGLRVSLTRRFLTEQLDFIRVAKDYVQTSDFVELVDRLIMAPDSHGKLGGKSAGLLLAQRILERDESPQRPEGIKVPRAWYVVSDGLLDFVNHNDLEDVIEQKYKEIDQVRQEYPNIIQLFKSSTFPTYIVNGLKLALDDLGDVPLIIRSSSLLEDRLGTAFSGKYKSLFLANQGNRQERLDALLDAVAEVYASVFGPDPIAYRRERGLLDFNEEMGLLIQEVVGTRVGKYWLPAFAGVAFSNNEFRWSPRIKREDGIVRLVPGLGTRAVDRVSDDYPVLVVPGQPTLKVNVAVDEVLRYSPRKLDVINLESATLETLDVQSFLREVGQTYPGFEMVFSVLKGDMLQRAVGLLMDPEKDELVTTFEGLVGSTPFVGQLSSILKLLQEHLGTAVDIEFAHDGRDFYLLQCRPQSYSDDAVPAAIPKDAPEEDIVFTANRHVSNGYVPDITHLVYVDPLPYGELKTRAELYEVGRVVGKLNKLLPKRQFILMGPGRWGSRGDMNLGVSVSYADISNTAMLIEIARKKGNYVPDLSFGTHFFQDLVESHIRYLPLYPDNPNNIFNERFLLRASNLLPDMLPEDANLSEVVHVIDVPASADGRVLRVLLNADLDEALGLLTQPEDEVEQPRESAPGIRRRPQQYWRWRLRMAERIAGEMDPQRFGVKAVYVFGSTKNATAGPGSDIDLLVHFAGTEEQCRELLSWLDGWSLCLAEMNYLRSGYKSDRLLDVHLVTDEDIRSNDSYACKIGAITDPARKLPLGGRAHP